MTGQVEILVLRSGHADALMQLFEESSRDAASANFHPHPFDAEWAERICRYQEKDLCFGLLHDGAMVAYATLAHGREIARSSQNTTSLRLTERNSSVLWTFRSRRKEREL